MDQQADLAGVEPGDGVAEVGGGGGAPPRPRGPGGARGPAPPPPGTENQALLQY